jgi:membrane associated rhomboid family serine protease
LTPPDFRPAPAFNAPTVVVALVGALAAIQGVREFLSVASDLALIRSFAFVPARFALEYAPETLAERLRELAQEGGDGLAMATAARFLLADGDLKPWTALTYALLHGGWAHVGFNSVWLLAFGSAVARRFGAARFLVFAAATAAGGALAHLHANFADVAPMIGASAIASGAMGAAARFAFQPGAPLGERISFDAEDEAWRLPAASWREALGNRRAALFLGMWFVMNLLFGLLAFPLGLSDGPIAWEAHIGGLLAGFLLFPLFDRT